MLRQLASNEHLDYVAALLDDIFRIPGTQIRFGLDALIGWVPGIGDAIHRDRILPDCFRVVAAGRKGSHAGSHDRERAAGNRNWRRTHGGRHFPRNLEGQSPKLPVADP